jgi:dihydroneopterin aldolase/2-amino-4-hydroxy-6-hydroxymethyldihydropteridine diphosphokinase
VRDRIDINGLRVMAVVGALHHERLAAQPLEIDLSLEVDLHDAGTSDELGDTVNYGAVTERVASVVAESKDILLERLAERIAACAVAFDRVDAVNVTLTKLRPPIAATVENTAVRIRRFRGDFDIRARASHRAIVALGSNLGDREAYLRFAISDFAHVRAVSHVYETAPVGGPDDQGAFLNMVIEVETSLDPFAFLRHCHRVEADALRQRIVHWGPRTLDVDLLFYDDITIESPELKVPHPRVGERRFVLAPLADVAPELCPPGWETSLPPLEMIDRGELPDLHLR